MSAIRSWRRSMAERAAVLSLTTFFWMVWLYFLTPLLSLLLWLAGYQLFTEEMLDRGGYQALLGELRHYGLVAVGMLLAMLSWVDWNLRHYGSHNKRIQGPDALLPEETARRAGLTMEETAFLQQARELSVDFDAQDRLMIRPAKAGGRPGYVGRR